MYGYFISPLQEEPEFDPGPDVDCPYCKAPLIQPGLHGQTTTLSIMGEGSTRSYFYRAHKFCYETATNEEKELYDVLGISGAGVCTNG